MWAELRKQGTPTADIRALDFDVILGAQARILTTTVERTIVVSTNLKHLLRMTETYDWRDPIWQTLA